MMFGGIQKGSEVAPFYTAKFNSIQDIDAAYALFVKRY